MWTDRDRAESLAWQADQGDRCPGCRGRLAETTDPDNEDAYAGHAVRCFKCRANHEAARDFGTDSDARAGLLTYSTRDPDVTATAAW